jgi:hypothetical protein
MTAPPGARVQRFGDARPHSGHTHLLDKWFVVCGRLYLRRDGSWSSSAHDKDFEGYFDSEALALALLHNNPNPYPG